MKKLAYFSLLFCLMASSAVLACDFDIDCQPGSKCLKQSAVDDGVCVGGLNPGNKNDDARRRSNRPEPKDAQGKQCFSNVDCPLGQQCLRERYSVNGACY